MFYLEWDGVRLGLLPAHNPAVVSLSLAVSIVEVYIVEVVNSNERWIKGKHLIL